MAAIKKPTTPGPRTKKSKATSQDALQKKKQGFEKAGWRVGIILPEAVEMRDPSGPGQVKKLCALPPASMSNVNGWLEIVRE